MLLTVTRPSDIHLINRPMNQNDIGRSNIAGGSVREAGCAGATESRRTDSRDRQNLAGRNDHSFPARDARQHAVTIGREAHR
jgi:hypothetical protein